IASMKKIIDPLCDEIRYERTCLRNWSSFMQSANVLSKTFRNFIKQSDGHNCGPLILK
ncbi:hypothetical protein KIL84_004202, partial [Mauremys mutica]